MNNNLPLISVIIPIYKTESYLNRCIESVINQTYSNLEIILVDDGSPDSCSSICDYWILQDNRIKVVHKNNGGAADAKNYGLFLYLGDKVAIVDSDDWILENMYQRLYSIMLDYNADIVDSMTNIVYSRDVEKIELEKNIVLKEYNAETALNEYMNDRFIRQTPWNKLFSRNVVDGIYFIKGKYIDDEYWTYKVIDKSKKYIFTMESFYCYYQRFDSAMRSAYSVRRLDAVGAMEERYYLLKDKYPNLRKRLIETYIGACKFHYQMLCYYKDIDSDGELRKSLMDKIRGFDYDILKALFTGKNKIWFRLFLVFPKFSCWIRNIFKIGW